MDMEREKAPQRRARPEGCLVVAVRLPVRIVALVLVVPVRLVWDALVVTGRFLAAAALRPLGRALPRLGRALPARPARAVWRYVLVPAGTALALLGHVLLVVPLRWSYRHAPTPPGHALARLARGTGAALAWLARRVRAALAWLGRRVGAGLVRLAQGIGGGLAWLYARVLTPAGHGALTLFVVPARLLRTWLLAPAGRALARCAGLVVTGVGHVLYWLARVLLVLPARVLWRRVLGPLGLLLVLLARETGTALGHAWRIAGHVSRAAGRFLGTLLRWTVAEPARGAYRFVLTPVGHAVRATVLRPAAAAARRGPDRAAGAGHRPRERTAGPRRRPPCPVRPPVRPGALVGREPGGRRTRTLDGSTTALTKD
ncbi:hypothetical protein AB0F77_14245 [Streptomyces sp. NPDC026672]|uniref:hypothetical protein n=1 Tax=unclassified Streptomyces TaxID=2593676 RepID=UPI00340B97F3